MASNLKSKLKTVGQLVAPRLTLEILSARNRAISHRLIKSWGLIELDSRVVEQIGNRVKSGPFQGMILVPRVFLEHTSPFLFGTYESELHPAINQILNGNYLQILDVGAKFGYYAVGFAKAFPSCPVIAFDTDWWARSVTREMAKVNNAPNLITSGFCSRDWLRENLEQNAFIFSDCEGFEHELFDLEFVPKLKSATILVEIHEQVIKDLGSIISKRFSGTHQVMRIDSKSEPSAPEFSIPGLSAEELKRCSKEVRGEQYWLFLTPIGASISAN